MLSYKLHWYTFTHGVWFENYVTYDPLVGFKGLMYAKPFKILDNTADNSS